MRYQPATAIISYSDARGDRQEWRVGCVLPSDNEVTMREHLKEWVPGAFFLGVRFEPETKNRRTAKPAV